MILLADDEHELVEWHPGILGKIGLAGEALTLTNLRVVAHRDGAQESLPLNTIGSARTAYSRDINHLLVGLICLIIGFGLALGYKSIERAANRAIATLEKKIAQDPKIAPNAAPVAEVEDGHRIAVPLGLVWLALLPLLAFGAFRAYEGLRGRTDLTLNYAGGSYHLMRFGHDTALLEFGQDVGRAMVN